MDETKVAGLLVVAAVVKPGDAEATRKAVANLRMKGQRRVHFTKESSNRRRSILSTLVTLPIESTVYDASSVGDQREARRRALDAVVRDLARGRAQRLVIERDDSLAKADRRTVYEATQRYNVTDLSYDLLAATDEPMLWVPDTVAWCVAKGGDWRRRVESIVRETVTVP